ncbi:MAG: insulinase family protein [Clostridia bacterium]|nr:insulinase family protein [Clostridia bacterium]
MANVRTIADGVRLCTVQTDRFKSAFISVSMAMPMTGNLSANALLIKVLKHSCKKYPDFVRLNQKLDELYGAGLSDGCAKQGESQLLRLSVSCIDDRFALESGEKITADCAELLCGMLFNPDVKKGAFNADAVNEEKRFLLQEIEEEINDKRTYAGKKCIEILCRNELFGKRSFGTKEEIEALTPEDLYEAWQNVLKTSTVMITCVSSDDGKKVEKLFRKGFSEIERQPVEITTEFRTRAGKFRRVEEKFPVNQGKLVLGFRTGKKSKEDNFAAYVLMNDIFGGNVYSKLFLNVREKLSLCYYCWARLISNKGILTVDCGIDTENEKKATDEILAQLKSVADGDFTDDDIKASVMGMRERWLSMDNPGAISTWYSAQILDENILTPEERVAMLEKVTKKEICAAAKRIKLEAAYMISAQEGETDET